MSNYSHRQKIEQPKDALRALVDGEELRDCDGRSWFLEDIIKKPEYYSLNNFTPFMVHRPMEAGKQEGLHRKYDVIKLSNPAKNVDAIVLEWDDPIARVGIEAWACKMADEGYQKVFDDVMSRLKKIKDAEKEKKKIKRWQWLFKDQAGQFYASVRLTEDEMKESFSDVEVLRKIPESEKEYAE